MITGTLLVRNEADRYLERVLINAGQYCDHIIAIDDGSDDATPEILDYYGVEILSHRAHQSFWGHNETSPRKMLWDAACAHAPDGWIYVFDADHELVEITVPDMKLMCRADIVDSWAFRLWDCWDSPDSMRADSFWQAHLFPRPWLFKALAGTWGIEKGIHSGHAPGRNWITAEAPGAIRHLGYIEAEHRALKHEKYLAI